MGKPGRVAKEWDSWEKCGVCCPHHAVANEFAARQGINVSGLQFFFNPFDKSKTLILAHRMY
ncbi:protein of unknown function [Denitratisoma oestradiolicum]|uniref:Uncharacterized protein n=1 Tax=Denitratisoma oestradiolicum TaxID=311182 RepID=A0A6S6XTD4_9PROT|nr:protein of unknown function [Denitratisoma oestradiolicum]